MTSNTFSSEVRVEAIKAYPILLESQLILEKTMKPTNNMMQQEELKENHIGDYMLNLNSGLMSVYTGKNKVDSLSMNFTVSDYVMKQIRALANIP